MMMLGRRLILLGIVFLSLKVFMINSEPIRQSKIDDDDDDMQVDNDSQKKVEQPPSINVAPQPIDLVTKATKISRKPLSTSPECQADVQKFCKKGADSVLPNLKVLQCVDDLDNAVNLISKECQHLIYSFKFNLTHDVRFDEAAERQCSKDLKILDDCNAYRDERGTGRLISCLYDQLQNISDSSCRYFINQLQSVVFGDWRLVENFAESCINDIRKYECGRLDDENEKLPHEQGAVISCLAQHYRTVELKCRKEIHRLAEMQSNDFHLDRALFYACREDRERLCGQVPAGNGRVYRCLYEKKFDSMMSPACRKEVHRRQMLVVENVQVDAPLIRACRSEMSQHNCKIDPGQGESRSSLTRLLLCLEDSMKRGFHIVDECRREMLVHRRMLMSDYILSPELVSQCKVEMVQHCASFYQQGSSGTIDQRGGRMIHCLLGALNRRAKFSSSCSAALKNLIRAVDPGNDIRSDPYLEQTCRPIIDVLCPRVQAGDSNIIMCLLDNLKNPKMTDDCEDRLMEISYFMTRDWRLTPRFARVCQQNLQTYCNLPSTWAINENMTDTQIGIFLSCLYSKKETIDRECRTELRRLMHIRGQSIGLMPEIEENCIDDLATCVQSGKKGEELRCLQSKYKSLQSECKKAVKSYTEMTMSDPTLDFLLMKACEPMIQLYCSNIENGNENELIRCLIRHKHEQRMDVRCRSGIDHHQIVSMKDEAFLSPSFRARCLNEINSHCQSKKTKEGFIVNFFPQFEFHSPRKRNTKQKPIDFNESQLSHDLKCFKVPRSEDLVKLVPISLAAVVQCLADLVLKDVLKRQNFINDECRNELKFELLQRSENIDFDPLLAKVCRRDVEMFCKDKVRGNAQIIDCLKENRVKLSVQCFARLKKREKIDLVLPETDYSLMSKCGTAIRDHCANENKQNVLSCLRRNINSNSVSNICRQILYQRLMILNSDARFNKKLIENCHLDIQRHCREEFQLTDDDGNDSDEKDDDDDENENEQNNVEQVNEDLIDREMGGRIIGCLRKTYVDTSSVLESNCVSELVEVIQTSKLDVRLDIQLYRACKSFLGSECIGKDQEDCLKLQFQKGKIQDENCRNEIKRIIREGKADVHIDRALTFACHADLLKYCNDIPLGSGKQLQCLIGVSKSVTSQCQQILSQRQELWNSISEIKNIADLHREIQKSSNSFYLITIILLVLCGFFMSGCFCRPYFRYKRIQKYK